jgi:Sulfotransferase family
MPGAVHPSALLDNLTLLLNVGPLISHRSVDSVSPESTTPDPLFIIGSPRSGTTLLAGLLRHTPWGEAFETHFIVKYFRLLPRLGNLSDPRTFGQLAERILGERPIVQRKLGLTPQRLYDSLLQHDYASMVDAIGRAYGVLNGHRSWGDKTPHYITDVDVLHLLFPRSKMLYIVRDGRDVALSLLERSWGPATIYTCAQQWQHENEPRPIFSALQSKGLLHDIRYEDLLAKPHETLAGILSFLGQDSSEDVLDELTASIRRTKAREWEREMSPANVELFESVAGETLRRFDYTVTHPSSPIGALAAMNYAVRDRMKHARNLFMMNVVDTVRIKFYGKEPFAE